jgi:hypothetical protein
LAGVGADLVGVDEVVASILASIVGVSDGAEVERGAVEEGTTSDGERMPFEDEESTPDVGDVDWGDNDVVRVVGAGSIDEEASVG